MAGSSVTASLDCEHRVIEKVLDALARFSTAPERVPAERWRQALDFLGGFADGLHHAKEEEVLFPALTEGGLPRGSGPVACMLRDHHAGRDLRRAMADALPALGRDPKAGEALARAAADYVALLRFHIQKEDHILFPLADKLLDEEEALQVARRFGEVVERLMDGPAVAGYVRIADELAAFAHDLAPPPGGPAYVCPGDAHVPDSEGLHIGKRE